MGLRVGSCWSWHGLEELTDEAHFAALQHCRRALLGLRLNAVLGGPARQRASKLIGAHTRSRTAGYQAFSFTLLRCQGAQQVGAAARLALRFTRVEPTDPVRDKRRAWLRSAAATQRVFRTLRMPRGPGTCGRKAHARAGASTSTWLCCAQPGRSRGGGPDGGLSTPSSMEVANGNRRRGGCVHGAAGVCAGLGGIAQILRAGGVAAPLSLEDEEVGFSPWLQRGYVCTDTSMWGRSNSEGRLPWPGTGTVPRRTQQTPSRRRTGHRPGCGTVLTHMASLRQRATGMQNCALPGGGNAWSRPPGTQHSAWKVWQS